MQNIKEHQLQRVIIKSRDEFEKDVCSVFGNIIVDYEPSIDSVFFFDGENDVDGNTVRNKMSEYYGVSVHNFYLIGVDPQFIFIIYTDL